MQALSKDGPAPRVLLVDDDAETLVLLRAALEGEGIDVVGVAGDGSEVEALAEQTDPHVVLMDLRMPGMDGFEATRSIKARRPWIQVIFLTFYEEMLPAGGPQEVGAFAYLVKGCSTQVMRDVIEAAWRHGLEQRWTKPHGV
jgi:CheY-like chemotaxis protein